MLLFVWTHKLIRTWGGGLATFPSTSYHQMGSSWNGPEAHNFHELNRPNLGGPIAGRNRMCSSSPYVPLLLQTNCPPPRPFFLSILVRTRDQDTRSLSLPISSRSFFPLLILIFCFPFLFCYLGTKWNLILYYLHIFLFLFFRFLGPCLLRKLTITQPGFLRVAKIIYQHPSLKFIALIACWHRITDNLKLCGDLQGEM